MIVIFVVSMSKSIFGKRLLMIFLWVFLAFSCPFSRFHGGDGMVKKGWNRRCSERMRWVSPNVWCHSCSYFHIDWCQSWIWVKATIAMLFLLWSLFDSGWTSWGSIILFLNTIVEFNYMEFSFFVNEVYMLSTPNNWNLFSNFNIYWLWGHLGKSITSSRVSSAPCIIKFVQY